MPDVSGVPQPVSRDPLALFDLARTGNRRALARLLSMVERGGDDARTLGRAVYPLAGNGYTVGLTGAPGAGKSTLTNALLTHLRSIDRSVAVLAIDPSSPFSGGAILGDRVRMSSHALDPDVFIRSMATRGHLGGLSLAVPEAVRVLEATGSTLVVVETVGVGQVEVEIIEQADTTVVVVNPGWGDAIQANKAGLMEIADVFVINKADRDGLRQTRHDLRSVVDMVDADWKPPIVETVATDGSGAEQLWEAIDAHRSHLVDSGTLETRRAHRRGAELQAVVAAEIQRRAEERLGHDQAAKLRALVVARRLDPYEAADQLLDGSGLHVD